ncbi:MAG: carboxypeptidase regulatory-like domain-containing protein [Vicinamibacterales bacterium]|nr:carboxypeptidase regulatory-like domain-containing protein [Vicinamibacterales bacterium]
MTWTSTRRYITRCTLLALLVALAAPAAAQTLTGGITGRATDESGGALPGVDVSIASPNMIGGARSAVTDEQGTYRFTLLPGGTYRVTFTLPGFTTLNIEGVTVSVGATMTINGRLTVATLEETVTVTSQAPTIDLQSANVNVNWDQQKMDDIPYARSLTGMVALVPGLYATSYDVGGSNFGTGSGPAARNFGRAGGNVVSYDGMIWDQTYGDFGSYEEAQVLTAAKGADALNPGVTMNLVVKSGSNTFRGVGSANLQDGKFQSENITPELLAKGYAPGVNKFTQFKDFYGEIGGPVLRDRLWFYASHRDASSGMFIPGFISLATGEQAEFYTKLQDPTLKVTYQVSANNKFEAMGQVGRKWQPYRTASRFVPLEATQNQDSWSLIGPSFKWLSVLSPSMTFDAGLQRGGYWWPDVPWTSDVRRTDLTTTTTHGAFLEVKRVPRRWQYNGTFTYFANLGGRSHEIKSGYLGWYNMPTDTEQIGYPNQQQYRYRSLAGDADPFMRPDSVLVYDYPNTVKAGEKYHSFYINDKIAVTPQFTLNVGLRFDRYSSFLPEQGNPGTGPFATEAIFAFRDDFPVYSTLVPRVSAVYDITGEGRIAVRASYGRYTGGGSGASANPAPGASNVNPNATITRTYSNWDGSIPYVPVAANLASVTGGGTNRRIDSDLKGPYMDEWTVGLDVGLSRTVTLQFNAVRKFDARGNKTWNAALPFSAYTDVRNNVDPGPDNIVGTADDGVIPVYSVPRSFPTFGQVIEEIKQHEDGEGRNRYTSFGVTMNKQLSSGWSLLVAYNADYRNLATDLPRNPNEVLYGAGTVAGQNYMYNEPEWNHALKVSGTYALPWGIQYGSALTVQSGGYYYREVQARNALNAAVTVRFPKAGQYETVNIWDNRISKRFGLPAGQSIEAMFDLFNSLNSNVILAQVLRNGPTFGQPTEIMAPRVYRLGVRYRF